MYSFENFRHLLLLALAVGVILIIARWYRKSRNEENDENDRPPREK
jgi:hypothetical protein